MELNFNCKVGELLNQLPKKAYYDFLATVLLNVQKQLKSLGDSLPFSVAVELYSNNISSILEADCNEIFSNATMELLNKEFNENATD